jgi:hypothetical protein
MVSKSVPFVLALIVVPIKPKDEAPKTLQVGANEFIFLIWICKFCHILKIPTGV